MLPGWMIDAIEKEREHRERKAEVGRSLWLPVPPAPSSIPPPKPSKNA